MVKSTKATGGQGTIPINDVSVGKGYLRRARGDISGLKNTISDVGLLQPIIVRKSGTGYVLIDGSRRLQALKELNVGELIIGRDVIVDIDETDADAMFKQVIANIQREDINDIELGHAFIMLYAEYGYSYREIAEIICKTPHYVAAKVGMAKRLTLELQDLIVRDWEEIKCIRNTLSDEDSLAPYEMNVNLIEDIARLPQELQMDAYVTIKTDELEKKEALDYLRALKTNARAMKLSDDIGALASSCLDQSGEQAVSDKELRTCLKKIDRDLDRLVTSVKGSGYTDKDKVIPVLESLIEKLYSLCSEFKSGDSVPGELVPGH
jgi:ParB family transcriptional regulator, chromosome partitioning protein